MSPSSVIFFMILTLPIVLLLVVALIWRKARTVLLVFVLVLSLVETYYVLYKQDAAVKKWYEQEAFVNDYLEEIYPEDDWISRKAMGTVFAETGVEVIFKDEFHIAYLYIVEEEDVKLVGYSSEKQDDSPRRIKNDQVTMILPFSGFLFSNKL